MRKVAAKREPPNCRDISREVPRSLFQTSSERTALRGHIYQVLKSSHGRVD